MNTLDKIESFNKNRYSNYTIYVDKEANKDLYKANKGRVGIFEAPFVIDGKLHLVYYINDGYKLNNPQVVTKCSKFTQRELRLLFKRKYKNCEFLYGVTDCMEELDWLGTKQYFTEGERSRYEKLLESSNYMNFNLYFNVVDFKPLATDCDLWISLSKLDDDFLYRCANIHNGINVEKGLLKLIKYVDKYNLIQKMNKNIIKRSKVYKEFTSIVNCNSGNLELIYVTSEYGEELGIKPLAIENSKVAWRTLKELNFKNVYKAEDDAFTKLQLYSFIHNFNNIHKQKLLVDYTFNVNILNKCKEIGGAIPQILYLKGDNKFAVVYQSVDNATHMVLEKISEYERFTNDSFKEIALSTLNDSNSLVFKTQALRDIKYLNLAGKIPSNLLLTGKESEIKDIKSLYENVSMNNIIYKDDFIYIKLEGVVRSSFVKYNVINGEEGYYTIIKMHVTNSKAFDSLLDCLNVNKESITAVDVSIISNNLVDSVIQSNLPREQIVAKKINEFKHFYSLCMKFNITNKFTTFVENNIGGVLCV